MGVVIPDKPSKLVRLRFPAIFSCPGEHKRPARLSAKDTNAVLVTMTLVTAPPRCAKFQHFWNEARPGVLARRGVTAGASGFAPQFAHSWITIAVAWRKARKNTGEMFVGGMGMGLWVS